MKLLKVLFLLFLFLIVCFSLYHIQIKEHVSANSYFLAIVATIVFTLCFLLLALKINIGGQYISLESDLANIQEKQEQLSKVTTALYKLLIVSLIMGKSINIPDKLRKKHTSLTNEIDKYLDLEDIAEFMDSIFDK